MSIVISNSLGSPELGQIKLKFERLLVEDFDQLSDEIEGEVVIPKRAPAPFEIPKTVEELYRKWRIFLVSRLRYFGLDDPEAIKDMEQSIYAHFHANGYLLKYDVQKGTFKNFLTIGIRNFLFNWYARQSRNPLRYAHTIVESLGEGEELKHGYVSLEMEMGETKPHAAAIEAKMTLDAFEGFLKTQKKVELRNGNPLSPWHVYLCLRDGLRTKDMARLWDITEGAVSNYKRYLRECLLAFEDSGNFLAFDQFR